jgi:hypothetical protein
MRLRAAVTPSVSKEERSAWFQQGQEVRVGRKLVVSTSTVVLVQ